MRKSALCLLPAGLLAVSALLSGCGALPHTSSSATPAPAHKQGLLHGGEQPVTGAQIQMYAVGAGGDGSASTPLLSPAAMTDSNGNFTITGAYTCPSASTLVYIVGTGGNPGLAAGTSNAGLGLMAALGPCGSLSASTFIDINEVTTVAAIYALAPYMTSLSAIGSGSGDATALADAFTLASELANTTNGATPGTGVPVGTVVPVEQINTLADILASCVNSAGGSAGDNSPCGNLFSLTTLPAGSTAPTNTLAALLTIAKNPTLNVAALYSLISATAPFEPSAPQAPPDLAVRLLVPGGLTISPSALTFPDTRVGATSAPQTVTITNNTAVPVGIDTPANLGNILTGAGTLSGGNTVDFILSQFSSLTCVTPLAPGASCTIQFAFKPSATGVRSAFFTVNNSSPDPVLSVPLTGNGLEANAGPATLSASSLSFSTPPAPQNVTLTNAGTAPLTIDGINISNDPTLNQPAFTQTNTCAGSLAPQSTCTITVTPINTPQPYSTGTLTVSDDAAGGPQTLPLTLSNGFNGAVLIDFGSRSVGTQGTAYFNNLGNPTTSTLTLTGPDATDFSFSPSASLLTDSCTGLGGPPSCSLTLYFNPSATGLRTASVTLNGHPYGGVIGVGLSPGIHFELLSSPYGNPTVINSLTFPTRSIGQSSGSGFTVLNTGTLPLTLNTPVLSGPAAADYAAASTCPSPLPPNAECQINLTVTPSQPSARYATLTLSDTTNTAVATLALETLGINAAPVVTPSSFSFPYTPLGTVSAPLPVTITTANNDPVSIQFQYPTDLSQSAFLFPNGMSCPQTPCQIPLVYVPTATNTTDSIAGQNYLAIDLFSSQSTSFTVQGTDTPLPSLSVTPTSLTFGPQQVNVQSNPQTITLTNTSTQDAVFNFGFSSGSYSDGSFFLSSSCGQGPIAPGTSCQLSVIFIPAVTGALADTAIVSLNLPIYPYLLQIPVQLSGTGTN